MKWQPIEAAPKDGTFILVFPGLYSGIGASIAKWDEDEYAKKPRPFWRRLDSFGRISESRDRPPTHWMPIPAAPSDERKEQEGR